MNIDALARSFLKKEKEVFIANLQLLIKERVLLAKYDPAVEVMAYICAGRSKGTNWSVDMVHEDLLPELAKRYDYSTDEYKYVNAITQEILQSTVKIINLGDVAPY